MTYIVLPNDSLLSIAEKFKVSVSDLIKENNLEYIYSLVPGLELIIPQESNITDSDNNDSNGKINQEEINEEIENSDNVDNDKNNSLFSYYIVVKGDNLYQIGKRYNISPQILADINGLDVNALIYPDQQILVPREGVGLYITKDGDSMQSVSKELNILLEDILINNKNVYLQPDQLLAYQVMTTNPGNF